MTTTYTAMQFYAAMSGAVFVGVMIGVFIMALMIMTGRSDMDEMGVQASQIDDILSIDSSFASDVVTELILYEGDKQCVDERDLKTRTRMAEGTLERIFEKAQQRINRMQK